MTIYDLTKLADKFEEKLSENKYDIISDKLSKIVKVLYPYVADNNLTDKGDYFELIIEIMEAPHYTSDKPKLSNEGFRDLLNKIILLIKNNFDVTDVSVKDFSDSLVSDNKIVAIIFKVAK